MKALFNLFLVFAKIGVMTFGGGYAMLPFLQRELVEKRSWITESELADYFAIGQCTPGIIAVNTATFVGHKLRGVWGGLFATFGIVFPSLVIIIVLAACISNFSDLEVVQNAFGGIRACVCALILNVVIKLWKSAIVSKFAIVIFIFVFTLAIFTDISSALLVIAAGILSMVFYLVQRRRDL